MYLPELGIPQTQDEAQNTVLIGVGQAGNLTPQAVFEAI
jgi:hypothetical protein